jgi:hypothetical protein
MPKLLVAALPAGGGAALPRGTERDVLRNVLNNYLAFSIGNSQFTGRTTGGVQFILSTGIQHHQHLVKAGINYRWRWGSGGM